MTHALLSHVWLGSAEDWLTRTMDLTLASDENALMQASEPHTPLFDPKPLIATGRRWSRWLGPLISFAILVASVLKLTTLDIPKIWALVPETMLFWMTFLASYFVGPVTDWLIFRRLWGIPVSGIVALVRKQLANALLPSYSGEVYFYAWARRRTEITGAPFGAIKDVAIISALTGNFVTLIMLIMAYPLFGSLLGGAQIKTFALSIGFIMSGSLIVMLFRSRLFSLPRDALIYTSIIVLIRTIANSVLLALMWHFALARPSGISDDNLSWWLLLATIKLLLSRLPFVANLDILFVSFVVFLIGHDQNLVKNIVAMVVGVTYVTHALLGLILGLSDILRPEQRPGEINNA